jgi:uncharacterized membrane protein YkoI
MPLMKALAATLMAAALLAPADDQEKESLLKRSTYSLGDAVKKALEIAKTGAVLSVELEDEDGKAVYSLDVAQGRKTLEIVLDARTGELVEKKVEDDDQESLARACTVPLGRAIEIALGKVSGQAYAAEAEMDDEKPVLEVKVKLLGDGKIHKVKIDPATGDVLKVRSRKIEGEKK